MHETDVNKGRKIKKGTKVKVKSKILPVHVVKARRVSLHSFLTPKSRCRWVVKITPQALYHGESTSVHTDREGRWAPVTVLTLWREVSCLYEDSNPRSSNPLHGQCTYLFIPGHKGTKGENERKRAKMCLSWVTRCSMPLGGASGKGWVEEARPAGLPACNLQPVNRPDHHSRCVAAPLYSCELLTRDMDSTQVSTGYTGLRNSGKVRRI